MPSKWEIPEWFIANCVTTSDEWQSLPETLVLGDDDVGHGNDDAANGQSHSSGEQFAHPTYRMASILFEPLQRLVQPPSSPCRTDDAGNPELDCTTERVRFCQDLLQLLPEHPGSLPAYPRTFLSSVVMLFSRRIGADLITLNGDDMTDLAEDVFRQTEHDEPFCGGTGRSFSVLLEHRVCIRQGFGGDADESQVLKVCVVFSLRWGS